MATEGKGVTRTIIGILSQEGWKGSLGHGLTVALRMVNSISEYGAILAIFFYKK